MLRISRYCAALTGSWGFRRLRTATTGAALWIPATGSALSIPASFKKLDQTFYTYLLFNYWFTYT